MAALTDTEYAVLGLLMHGTHSGYEIAQAAKGNIGYFWAPARSQIYAVLPRLVAAGLATRREVAQTTRPDKHLYTITMRGRQELERWLADPKVERDANRYPLLLKLFFGRYAPSETLREMVEQRRQEAESALREFEELERELAGSEESFYGYMTLLYGLELQKAKIRWAETVLTALAVREAQVT
jgi:PadR family transcriptional regulator, regulatory protein AphA